MGLAFAKAGSVQASLEKIGGSKLIQELGRGVTDSCQDVTAVSQFFEGLAGMGCQPAFAA